MGNIYIPRFDKKMIIKRFTDKINGSLSHRNSQAFKKKQNITNSARKDTARVFLTGPLYSSSLFHQSYYL